MQTGRRTYGLALALGVGAAIAAGHGTALADSTDSPGSTAPAGSSERADAPAHRSTARTHPAKRPARVKAAPADDHAQADPAAPADAPAESLRPEAAAADSANRPNRSRRTSAPTAQRHRAPVQRTRAARSPAAEAATVDRTAATADPVVPAGTAPSAVPAPAVTVTIDVPAPAGASPAATKVDPAERVTARLVRANDLLADRLSDTEPTAPAGTSLMGLLAAFAQQESTRTARLNRVTVKPDTTALVDDTPVDAAAPALPVEQTRVPVVTERVAPLEFLQHIPIIGPLIVTPIVALIHQIPLVSDLIHPWVGYPLHRDQPADSAQPRDVSLMSFDGTRISVHFMPAAGLQAGHPAPTVLYGPGLPMPGATNIDGTFLDSTLADLVGMVSIAKLRQAGYNVVTWDPRGEYLSGGRMEIDSPDFEARDVSAIISWVSSLPEAQLDSASALDPRIGMVGVSYGGGIQLVTAGIDKRVDAIVPTIAWNSLNTSLDKSGAPKTSWATLLTAAIVLTGGHPNPQIYAAVLHGFFTGQLSQADTYFLTDRSAGALSAGRITVPTLMIQGTVDTLFSLQETDAIAQVLNANGVTTKMLWFCGGHGLCINNPNDPTDGQIITARTLEWLDRYVKGDTSVSTGPAFEWVDQRGRWFSADTYQLPPADPIVVSGGAGDVLKLVPVVGGSGVPLIPLGFKASNAVNVTIPAATTTAYVVGAPQLTLSYSGTGVSRFVYAQLVDDSTGLVLGTQVTPVPVTLDGQTHEVTVSLEPVAYTLLPGQTVTLQLVADAGTYQDLLPSLGELVADGKLTVAEIRLTLPTVDAAAISGESVPLPTAVQDTGLGALSSGA